MTYTTDERTSQFANLAEVTLNKMNQKKKKRAKYKYNPHFIRFVNISSTTAAQRIKLICKLDSTTV